METNTNNFPVCEHCHVEMHKKLPDLNEIDINRLSLLAMFRIQEFYLLECPCCQNSGLYIGAGVS